VKDNVRLEGYAAMLTDNQTIALKNITLNCKAKMYLFESMWDRLANFEARLSSSKVYGVIGKPGGGAWALSYLLSGKAQPATGEIYWNGELAAFSLFRELGWYVGELLYSRNKWGLKTYPTVQELIAQGENRTQYDVAGIVDELELSPSRLNRPMPYISNERWNATVAIGLVHDKKLFCFPWLDHSWKERMESRLERCSSVLRRSNAITIIPSNDTTSLTNIVDEFIYLT
jgi:ABC-type multidrug transport system ATPase subunit